MDNNKLVLKRYFNLRINVNSAAFENSSIGPNLSPFMVRDKINKFCLEFNELSNFYKSSEIELFVRLNLYYDNSFNFIIKGPKLPFLLKLFFNVDKLILLKNQKINLYLLFKIIFIKNYFFNKNFEQELMEIFLRNQYRNLFYSIIKFIK